jgi:hypothetical protein
LQAILSPKFESALYFTYLQENNRVVFLIKADIYLLLPVASSFKDKGSPTLSDEDTKARRAENCPSAKSRGTPKSLLLENHTDFEYNIQTL